MVPRCGTTPGASTNADANLSPTHTTIYYYHVDSRKHSNKHNDPYYRRVDTRNVGQGMVGRSSNATCTAHMDTCLVVVLSSNVTTANRILVPCATSLVVDGGRRRRLGCRWLCRRLGVVVSIRDTHL